MQIDAPIDLRARVAPRVGPRVQPRPRPSDDSTESGSLPAMTGPYAVGSPWSRLVDSLIGDILLGHVPGRRVLDLGYGSPEIAEWISERVGDRLSIVEKGNLETIPKQIVEASGFLPATELYGEDGTLNLPDPDELLARAEGEPGVHLHEYRDASFDVVYCLRTFPHLGHDTETSERLSVQLLREAARVTADGGTLFVQIANPRSLRGIVEGIRNPVTVVSRRRMILGDRYGLTRWDTLPRFQRLVPQEFELLGVHGLGVLIPHNATLQIPVVGRLLARLEWVLRDMGVVRHFGAQLLVVLRRLHRSDPSIREGGSPRTSLSSSLISAISASSSGSASISRPKS
ncbi:hypothetical protein PPSIR1_16235 [Plesiocystis pacifica SIR-1]|uniref:Methyltransferase type 11 domain-containing protein n=2 Tax=Plesiocystis pacifica TaxID=191768 RepID=A6GJW8_9BACT|nr:hypothetical protein PPSIR1_16235 [Plesiocystis pacifica SIR-1]